MAKHTEGPWAVTLAARDAAGVFKHQIGTQDRTVAYTWAGKSAESQEQVCNAQLIAAAPELLEACRAGGRYSNALKKFQDEGKLGQAVDGAELDLLFEAWHNKAHAAIAKATGGQPNG